MTFKDKILSRIGNQKPTAWGLSIGLNLGVIDRIFRQGVIPGPKHLTTIAKALEVTVDWLITNKGEMFAKKESPVAINEILAECGYNSEEVEYIKMLIDILRGQNKENTEGIKSSVKAFWKNRDTASDTAIPKKTKKAV